MVNVDSQDRPEPVSRVLAARHRIVGCTSISQRDIEKSVRPEIDVAAVVVLEWIFRGNPDPLFTLRIGRAGVVARRLESRDHRVALALVVGRIVNEERFVLFILGMERHAQKALFVSAVNRVGQLQE